MKRTFNWLWTQLIEHLDELREEANEESIRDALVRPKVKGAPAPKKEGDNKPEPSVPANPAPPSKRKERVPKARKEKGKVKVKEKGKQEIQRIRMGSQRRQEEVKARTPKVKVRATGRHKPRKPPFHVCFSQKGPVTGVRTVLSHVRFPMQRLLRQRRKVHPLQQRAQLQQSP